MTVVIQIGNSDDKLTQAEWAEFCRHLKSAVAARGQTHFAAAAEGSCSWQNFCIAAEINGDENLESLKTRLSDLAATFRQDSIAVTIGPTEFLTPSTTKETSK